LNARDVDRCARCLRRLSVTRLHTTTLCKQAKWIEVLRGVEALGDPRNIVLDGSLDFLHRFDAAFTKLIWPLVLV